VQEIKILGDPGEFLEEYLANSKVMLYDVAVPSTFGFHWQSDDTKLLNDTEVIC
jgi:hypothetical protein